MFDFNSMRFMCACILWVAACGPGRAESDSGTGTDTDPDTDPVLTIATCMGNLSCGEPPDPCLTGECTSTCPPDGCETSTTCATDGCSESSTTCAADGCGESSTTCATDGCDEPTTEAEPRSCAPGIGGLQAAWEQTDAESVRGEAVSVGVGRVAWIAGDFMMSHIRVLDADGGLLWEQSREFTLGEAEVTAKDLVIVDDGGVVVAGTNMLQEGSVLRFNADGMELSGVVGPASEWSGVARATEDAVVVVGSHDDDMAVFSVDLFGMPLWFETFADMGAAWSSDVFVGMGRLFVSGHSNQSPGPVLLAYDLAGGLQWSVVDPGGPLELSFAVTGDAEGRIFRAVIEDDGTGRIDRFDAGGALETSFDLDYAPRSLVVDVEGRLVIAGARKLSEQTVIVERRDADGALVAEHSRAGWRALGLAVDAECRSYVVGDAPGGAWLARLD